MSGLLHLVEAATALTRLPVGLPPTTQQAYPLSSSVASPISTGTLPHSVALALNYRMATQSHNISDDDDAMSANANAGTPCTKMAALRENHLQALRAAAASAGLVTTPALSVTQAHQTASPPVSAVTAAPPATAQIQAPLPQQVTTKISRGGGDTSKEAFPMRLHALLADPTVRDVISWLPHGKSFVVLRPDVFATRVLPRYFAPEGSNSLNAKTATVVGLDGSLLMKNRSQGVHKYPSFTRKLNRWGFRQISRGPDAGAFCHELFQRDEPELSRGMVCQKSRKLKKTLSGLPDDLMSVSSASTMGTKISSMGIKGIGSGEKRPFSSTVTVSTAGGTSHKSLPPKKRKSGQHITNSFMMNDIPSMISHRNQKMTGSASSITESDLTSETGSVCSNNLTSKATAMAAIPAVTNSLATSGTAAREALARHFHEQHRAFALASLMENSRIAMEAIGMKSQPCTPAASAPVQSATASRQSVPHFTTPVLGAMTTHSNGVFAPTVTFTEQVPPRTSVISTAEAAKSALYQAYLQALSSNSASRS